MQRQQRLYLYALYIVSATDKVTWSATFSRTQRNKSLPLVMACRATAGVPSLRTLISEGTISGKKSTCINPISPSILHLSVKQFRDEEITRGNSTTRVLRKLTQSQIYEPDWTGRTEARRGEEGAQRWNQGLAGANIASIGLTGRASTVCQRQWRPSP